MDSHYLLVEVTESSSLCAKGLDSPYLSSGYCSSEDSHTLDNVTCKISGMQAEHYSTVKRCFYEDLSIPTRRYTRHAVAKTGGADFDDLSEFLFKPLAVSTITPEKSIKVSQRSQWNDSIHHGNNAANEISVSKSSSLGQAMSQFSRHLTAEFESALSDIIDNHQSVDVVSYPADGACVVPRSQCNNATLPSSVVRRLSRKRGGATIASCGVLLRHSASVPSKINAISGQSNHSPRSVPSSRVPVTAGEALRDHMYAMKPSALGQSESALVKRPHASQHQNTNHFAFNNKMSILETFLRSTTARFDANRGSTELAAEEFGKLHVTASSENDERKADEDSQSTSSLLKQLLTGEISSAALEHNRPHEDQLQMCPSDFAVDSVLTDGFGLDANLQLDDPLSNGIGLLGASCELMTPIALVDDSQMMLSCDLDDSIQEQSRQEGLMWQHYYLKGLL